jgi:CHAT domain-containing protein
MIKYFLLLILVFTYNYTSANDDPGLSHFKQGHFEYAVQHWAETLSNISAKKNPKNYIDISLRLAMAYHALGRLRDALEVLKSANKINYDNITHANVLMQLSDVYLAMRNLKDCEMKKSLTKFKKAENYLDEAHKLAKCEDNLQHPLLCANILNRQSNMLLLPNIEKFQQAGEKYCKSAKLADSSAKALSIICQINDKPTKKSLDKLLSAKIFINLLNAAAQSNSFNKWFIDEQKNLVLFQYIKELPNSHDKSFAFISIAKIMLRKSLETEQKKYIYQALTNAITVARTHNNHKAIAYAQFYLAQLYAKAKRYEEAIQFTRQAIFYAKKGYPDLLFRLEWQLGSFFAKAEKPYQKIYSAYKRANKHLELVRETYTSVSQKFRDDIEKFYFNWADLLLQQKQLKQAIETIELFKKAEIRNYFQNDCITEKLQGTIEDLDQLPKNVAVFYPLLFDDRIELLTMNRGKIQQTTILKKPNLKTLIKKFSEKLAANDNDWQTNAQTLYNWLIKPIILDKQIDTLIIVPNSVFRNIPFAALHDEKTNQFLIEKYALVISPGIKLTIPTKAMQLDDVQALLTGSKIFLSRNSRGKQERDFENELNDVPQELDSIANILEIQTDDIILNEDFTLNIIQGLLHSSPYSIIHFATHAQFKDDLSQTFLRTYDGKITMDDLEELMNINKQIELLTLSACETAVGNDRAVLGLAGIAIKTGVPSVLATLWKVDDLSTRDVIVDFYRQLKENKFSKAKALQQAQKNLLKIEKYKHPYYWAPFVLIGNWL